MGALRNLSGKRVLVTGAAGFVGAHVCNLARSCGALVTGTSSRSTPGCVTLDVGDGAAVSEVIRSVRPEIVIHLASAGVTGTVPFGELLRVNAGGVQHLLEACASLERVPTVVLAGSGFEYGSQERPVRESDPVAPFSLYGISKAAGSQAATLWSGKLPIVLLRLFNIYGPGEAPRRLLPHIVRSTLAGKAVETTLGEQLRDFVFVQDAAEALLRCGVGFAQPGLTTLNLGSGTPVRLRDFICLVAEDLRRRGYAPDLRFGAIPYRVGEPMSYQADQRAFVAALGWAPAMPLPEGVKLSVEHILKESNP